MNYYKIEFTGKDSLSSYRVARIVEAENEEQAIEKLIYDERRWTIYLIDNVTQVDKNLYTEQQEADKEREIYMGKRVAWNKILKRTNDNIESL